MLAVCVLGTGLAAAQEFPQPGTPTPVTSTQYPGVTCRVVQAPMRDGVKLTTFLYEPQAAGRYPVIMIRSPYGRLSSPPSTCFSDALGGTVIPYAQQGYVGVVQEVRGTYTSEGIYNPVFQEINDGYDAIEWAARQSFSNGKIGMMGPSYLAITQWEAAGTTPPHLVAIAPSIMATDYHDNVFYENGAFILWEDLTWPGATIVPDQIARYDQLAGKSADQIAADVSSWTSEYAQNIKTNWPNTLPLSSFDLFDSYAPLSYQSWVHHPNYDQYWARVDTNLRYGDIKVPALISGDWYDPFHVGTIESFYGMRLYGGTAEARQGTKLIMGAYGHSGDSGTPTFGTDTPDPQLTRNFFDYYLKGIDNGELNAPLVNLYVLVPPNSGNTGSGFWVTGNAFPLEGTQTLRLYLSSNGHANTRNGDGTLLPGPLDDNGGWWYQQSRNSPPDYYTYDPGNPVPTTGGNMCCDAVNLPAGAREQSTVELRDDVLVYTSQKLTRDTPVIGSVGADFWAISSAVDTDFTVKLVDVHPDGRTHNVLDRIVRARFRDGSNKPPSLLVPGRTYEYQLNMGSTGTVIRAGHQIRVEISSSNFPHFSRNLNIAQSPNYGATWRTAQQTLLHDWQHPSFIVLPVNFGVQIPASV
ncbi:MAG: CocE/NonD family hydrolase, partial [Acetobacteraceae bacterium]|nr:CocE/NonD family hydrolase [Acetobacteraceae bacterium]